MLRAAKRKNANISGLPTGHLYLARNRTFLIGGNSPQSERAARLNDTTVGYTRSLTGSPRAGTQGPSYPPREIGARSTENEFD